MRFEDQIWLSNVRSILLKILPRFRGKITKYSSNTQIFLLCVCHKLCNLHFECLLKGLYTTYIRLNNTILSLQLVCTTFHSLLFEFQNTPTLTKLHTFRHIIICKICLMQLIQHVKLSTVSFKAKRRRVFLIITLP